MASNERLITPVLRNSTNTSSSLKPSLTCKPTSVRTSLTNTTKAISVVSATAIKKVDNTVGFDNPDITQFVDQTSYQGYLAAQLLKLINNTTNNILDIFKILSLSIVGNLYINNINGATSVNLKQILNKLPTVSIPKLTENVYNGNILNVPKLYNLLDTLYPSVKSNTNANILNILSNTEIKQKISINTDYFNNISLINGTIQNSIVANIDTYNYMKLADNLVIDNNVNFDSLFKVLDLYYPTIKPDINANILSTINTYSGNILSPFYSYLLTNVNIIDINNTVNNINYYNYIQANANIYIDGYVNNEGLYTMVDLLYPNVKIDKNNNLLDIINNYKDSILTPYYSLLVSNLTTNDINNTIGNQRILKYMQTFSNIYINGNISNNGLYKMMDLLYPNVKTHINNNLLNTITTYSGNILAPYYSQIVQNINISDINNKVNNVNLYDYIQLANNIYINGNINNDGLYTMMDLLYPNVKTHINNDLLNTITTYSGNILAPYYSLLIGNINIDDVNNIVNNVNLYDYMQLANSIYINGNISNDGLYTMMDLLYPNIKTSINNDLLNTINTYSGNILAPYYSALIGNITINDINNIVNNVKLYDYMQLANNIYINGNISNDGLYTMMDLLYPNVKTRINNDLLNTINTYSGNILAPYYSSLIANISIDEINNKVKGFSIYTYMQTNADIYTDKILNNNGLYKMMDLLYPIVINTIDNELLIALLYVNANIIGNVYYNAISDINEVKLYNLVSNIGIYDYVILNNNLYINNEVNIDQLIKILKLLFPELNRDISLNVETNTVHIINDDTNDKVQEISEINDDTHNKAQEISEINDDTPDKDPEINPVKNDNINDYLRSFFSFQ